MDLKAGALRLPIFIFLFIFFLISACSTPSWFPIKKGPPHRAKTKELIDKEVVLIDNEEYVKVLNPKASEGREQPKYIYVPVNEYLLNRGAYATPTAKVEDLKRGPLPAQTQASPPVTEKEIPVVSLSKATAPDLKKKVLVAHFEDRTTAPEEMLGDWISDRLIKEVDRRSHRVLFVDYLMIKDFLEKRGIGSKDLETPEILRLLNEVFGIQAIVSGRLSGPYVFTTRTADSQDSMASAIIRIEVTVVDTLSGKPLKQLSVNNPFSGTRQRGPFPEEKAKIKAIDLTLADLSWTLLRELEGMDWSCRIVKIEGDEIYLNAGKLAGLKMGDLLEVFRPGENGNRGEMKGTIRISGFLGIDASTGIPVDAKKLDVRDVVRPASR